MKSFIKNILWILKKTIFGFVSLYAFNFIGSLFDIEIASNYISYFAIGTLGLPGLLLVYIANVFLFS